MRTLARWVVDGILYVMLFLVLALTVPRVFGFQYITIQSGSMLPVLEVGSACIISPDKDGYHHLTRQDIITYELEGANGEPLLITHRIRCINGDGTYTTKGDNNDVADARRVDKSQIVGIVRFHVPYAGYLLDHMNNGVAKGAFAACMVVLVILSLLLDPGHKKVDAEEALDEQEARYRRQSRKKPAAMGLAAQKVMAEDAPGEVDMPVSVDADMAPKVKRKAGALSLEAAAALRQGSFVPVDSADDMALPDVGMDIPLYAEPTAAPRMASAKKKAGGSLSLEEAMRRKAGMA